MNKYTVTIQLVVNAKDMNEARDGVDQLTDYNLSDLLECNGSITVKEELNE